MVNKSHRDILYKKQQGRCCYCNIKMRKQSEKDRGRPDVATIEHLQRVADGGQNVLDNKALACLSCNSDRGELDWLTYKSYKMGELTFNEVAA